MLNSEQIKEQLGKYAAGLVSSHTTIGLGTGSTVERLIKELAVKIAQGMELSAVATSSITEQLAAGAGIKIIALNDISILPITIDGTDEVDSHFNMIKGGGGALLQEKMVAASSKELVIIADESKLVTQLGQFPLPVEVIAIGWKQVKKQIENLGCKKVELRLANNIPYVTDNGHFILDCHFASIPDPTSLNIALHLVPGVVETGLFIRVASKLILGYADGRIEVRVP